MELNFKLIEPVFITDDYDYSKCRNCLLFSFYIDTCENCHFKTENKKITPVPKMNYVKKLLRRHRTEIKPNHYVYGVKDYESVCEKYKKFLVFLYLRNNRKNVNVRHQYFISKMINEQPKKTIAKLEKIWDEWILYYSVFNN